ncbi:amidase domain-containing protein [Nocardia australiensis]|uniref:amidase domain-containing protein n=1 Tax=Nocardia australiensis TaxID=2887191 RepID=UPI001D14688A|nr:amidase domain-containing protein [Nocardia australiensis]
MESIPTRDQVTSWNPTPLKDIAANAGKIGDEISLASAYVHKALHDDLHWSGAARTAAEDRADREQREMRAVANAYYDLESAAEKLFQAIEYSVDQIKQIVKLHEVEPVFIGNDQAWTVHNMENEDEAVNLSGSLVSYATTIAEADAFWKPKIQQAIDEIRRMAPIVNGVGIESSGSGLSPARAAAVEYANQWALGRNPDYADLGEADCTNFVSQCLRAGGFQDEGDGGVPKMHRDDNARWYYDDDRTGVDKSYTWGGAPNLHDYLLRDNPKDGTPSGSEAQVGSITTTTAPVDPLALSRAGLKPGDIVQYELNDGANAGTINHTAIYVGQKPVTMPNGETVMADVVDYHSKENKQVPWSLQQGSDESFPLTYHMIKVDYPGD